MKIDITARQLELTEKVRDYVRDELTKLEKYYDRIIDCRVVIETIRKNHIVELKMKVYRQTLVTKETSDDIYKSIDSAVDKLRRRLKRYKAHLKGFEHVTAENRAAMEEMTPEEE